MLVPLVKDTNRGPPFSHLHVGVCVGSEGPGGWRGGIECLLDKHTEAGRDRVSPGWGTYRAVSERVSTCAHAHGVRGR